MADLTVVTYGGGEILNKVFNAMAMLFNGGKGGIVQPLMMITASIGGIWALSKAFFSSSAEGFLNKYLFPLIAFPCLLLVPTSSVKIEDILQNKSYKVDNVPFLLAKVSELTSSIGYRVTEKIESVMHIPNDISYNKTGMLFGGETSLDFSRFQLTNATLERNLGKFSRQCVMYDLALGLYSIDDLKKTTDLWKFLRSNTSKVRLIPYSDPCDVEHGKKPFYLNCQQALDKMAPFFEREKHYYARQEIFKNLPLTFQALTGLKKSSEELISQQLMMNVLSNDFSASKFAKTRAEANQRSTYQVLGSLAGNSLVTIRAVVEALIYASFVLIVALCLLPGGGKFLLTWIFLNVWIQLWPPMYAILNYIMLSVSSSHVTSMLSGLHGDQLGLSIFTSVGLRNFHEDVHALSGYLSASIPFLTYAILQGGSQSVSHIVGSLMTPAHSAATTAASEQASGNYSFANTNFGQMSYGNTSSLQTNTAPNLTTGYFSENQGDHSTIFAPSGPILNQSASNLVDSLTLDKTLSESLQSAHQRAETQVGTAQKNYMESVSSHARDMTDLTEHIAKSTNFSHGLSEREAVDLQESARFVLSQAESWGAQHGLSERESAEAMLGMSISGGLAVPFLGGISGENKNNKGVAVSSDEALNAAKSITSSQDFQSHFQKVQDFAKTASSSSMDDQGVRFVEGFTHSLDQVRSTQDQLSSSLAK